MRRIIFTLLILPMVLTCAAQKSFDVNGVTYVTTSSSTVSATGGVPTLTSLVIPETVTFEGKSYTVTEIGDNAFIDCPLTEVTLPSTLLSFGMEPFNGSNGLVITSHAVQAPVSIYSITSDRDKCTLRIPAIAFDDYYSSRGWNGNQWGTNFFGAIEYIDYEPKTVFVHSDFSFTRVPETSPNLQLLISPGEGKLTVDKPMSFGNYTQFIDFTSGHFSTIICNDKMTASSVRLNVTLDEACWNFVMFPFDVNVSNLTFNSASPTYIREFDGNARANNRMNETWVDVKRQTLQAYQAYIIYNKGDDLADDQRLTAEISASGTNGIFTAREVSILLSQYPSEFAQDCNWNLIGNPYPCFYDIRAFGITNPITVGGSYGVYTAVSPLDDGYVLNPFQAFFIQSESGMSSLDFPLDGRSHSKFGIGYARLNRVKATENREVLNILLESSLTDFADRTRIVINEAAKLDYEISRDAAKFFDSGNELQQIYTIANGTNYAINEKPEGDGTTNIGMIIAKAGEYTLRMQTESELPVTLIDHETGTYQRFNAGDTYTFSAVPGIINNRFTLLVGQATGVHQVINETSSVKNQPTYNLNGQKVGTDYKGIVIRNGKKNINK